MIWLVIVATLLAGCSTKTEVVYREPKIVFSEPYKLRDGSKCRDLMIYRGEEGRKVEVKTICVR